MPLVTFLPHEKFCPEGLTVEVPILSSSSAAAMPPQSTTVRNTRSRRRSMSLIWPRTARFFICINRQLNSDICDFIRVTEPLTMRFPLSASRGPTWSCP